MDARQQAMLREIGIRLPWPAPARPQTTPTAQAVEASATQQQPSTPQRVNAPPTHSQDTAQQIQEMRARVAELRGEGSPAARKSAVKTQAPTDVPAQTPQTTVGSSHPATTSPATTTTATTKPVEVQDNFIKVEDEIAVLDAHALEARRQEISQMSWEELEAAVNQCTACSLCKTRTQAVFSAGVPTAEWMIVGEAPDEQEDKQGEPFVGPAGQLLDRMLEQLNISRAPTAEQTPIYISNVLKCRPPRNRNPDPQEMALCEPFLMRQIELIQPKIILIMGRFAVQTLLETKEAIGRLRGQVHDFNGTPAIVTYHPAYLLRNPIDKRKSWDDLCLAAETVEKFIPKI